MTSCDLKPGDAEFIHEMIGAMIAVGVIGGAMVLAALFVAFCLWAARRVIAR